MIASPCSVAMPVQHQLHAHARQIACRRKPPAGHLSHMRSFGPQVVQNSARGWDHGSPRWRSTKCRSRPGLGRRKPRCDAPSLGRPATHASSHELQAAADRPIREDPPGGQGVRDIRTLRRLVQATRVLQVSKRMLAEALRERREGMPAVPPPTADSACEQDDGGGAGDDWRDRW